MYLAWELLMNGTKEFVRVFSLITSFIFHVCSMRTCFMHNFILNTTTRGKLVNDLAQLEACKHVSLMGVVTSSIQFMETLSRLYASPTLFFDRGLGTTHRMRLTVQKVTQALAI